ncbi:MAG: GNAT family N-acetyltransferase [Candidatus Aminicenantales bacterium]
MGLQILNPNEYPDWDALLLRSRNHSFFHTSAWAKVLETTYRFKPLYFVLLEEGQIALLMPLMEVYSPLKGKRGVSLPFTDQCTPHVLKKEFLQGAVQCAIEYGKEKKWRYIEWRAGEYFAERISPWEAYYVHDIDLVKPESGLFSVLSDNNRRNIKKAIREGVAVKIGQSFDSIESFYRLNCITRKRHGLPPQPFTFFKYVFEYIISKGCGTVVSASHKEKVIAASVFFHFGTSALFKYGASEMENQNLRPNNLIMWEALKWYSHQGFKTMNLGRTELENHGLLQYKRTWGAKESLLKYYRYDIRKKTYLKKRPGSGDLYTRLFARTPTSILRIIGRLFYKHAG